MWTCISRGFFLLSMSGSLVCSAATQDQPPGSCVAGVVVNEKGERLTALVSICLAPVSETSEFEGEKTRAGAFIVSVPKDIPQFHIATFCSEYFIETSKRLQHEDDKCRNIGAMVLEPKNLLKPQHRQRERAAFMGMGSSQIRMAMLADDRAVLERLRTSGEVEVVTGRPVQAVRYVNRAYCDPSGQMHCVREPICVMECSYTAEKVIDRSPELAMAIAELENLVREMETLLGEPNPKPVTPQHSPTSPQNRSQIETRRKPLEVLWGAAGPHSDSFVTRR